MTDLSQKILYEDDDILAINKPAGLVVHFDGRTEEANVSEWFVSKYPEARNVGEPLGEIDRPGIVHRIDRETSGALLLARTEAGHECLKTQFQKREIEKIYHLFVYGEVKDESGMIDLKISRSKSDFRKRVAGREGREALTHFQVLKRAQDKSATFLEAQPKTGRTHQIRAHFKALHHPVVCDKLYASKKPCLLGFERLALHAQTLTFKNVSGKSITIEAPYPNDFKNAVDMIS